MSTLWVLGRTLDTFVGLFLGRPDKYWSWAAASALFVGLGFFFILYGGVPISEAFPVGETIIGFGLPLLLVPLRMKSGWPRG